MWVGWVVWRHDGEFNGCDGLLELAFWISEYTQHLGMAVTDKWAIVDCVVVYTYIHTDGVQINVLPQFVKVTNTINYSPICCNNFGYGNV